LGLNRIVLRGIRLAGSGYVLTQTITFGAYFALAKLITPADFGHFAAAILVAGIGTLIGDGGMATAVIQRQGELEEVANTAFLATLVTGSIATLVALAAAPLLGFFFHSAEVGEIAAVMSGWLALRMLSVVPVALLQRRLSFLRRVVVDPLAAVAYLIAAVVAGTAGLGAWTLVIATYAGALVTAGAAWALAGWWPRPRLARRAVWRELARFGRPIVLAEFILRGVAEVPVAGIGRFLGAAPLGQFTYAMRVAAQPMGAVVEGVSYVLLPSFARIAHDRERFQAAVRRAVRAVWAVSVPAGLIMFSLGAPAMTTVFGHRWHQAGYALMALSVCVAVGSLESIASEAWKASGRVGLLPRMHGLSLALTVVLVAASLPLGLVGVCAAISVTAAVVGAYAVWGIRQAIGVPIRTLSGELVGPGAAGVAMALGVFGLDRLVVHAGSRAPGLAVALLAAETVIGAVVYLALLRVLAPAAADEIRHLVRPLRGRLRRRPHTPVGAAPLRRHSDGWPGGPWRPGNLGLHVNRATRILLRPTFLLAAGGVVSALAIGALTAHKPSLGIVGVVGLAYVPLVLLDLPVGIALWGALVFFSGVVGGATSAAELLLAIAWIGVLAARRNHTVATLGQHRFLLTLLALLMLWMTLSLLWAPDHSAAVSELRPWLIVGAAMVIAISVVDSPRAVYWILGAFVLAAALTITVELARNGLAQVAGQNLTVNQGDPARLEALASTDDPNYLAAVVVAALAVSVPLFAITKNFFSRAGLWIAVAIMALGLAAAQSRGGLVSALVAMIAAFALFPRHRARMFLALIPVVLVVGAFFASDPEAARRVTTFTSGGSGRTELWTVADRMWQAHPINGVGIGNYESASAKFVQAPGDLQQITELIVRAQLVHNEYLQLLAELGVVGLLLYLAVVGACMRAAWAAARIFDRLGLEKLSMAARGLLVGEIGLLASAMFVSNGDDRRYWLLLALGPALLGIAHQRARAAGPRAAVEAHPALPPLAIAGRHS
jgi:O-antigen/teichoic acid export membrane protein/O-antigen ligase